MAYNFKQELVLLGTQTASAASSVSFTTGISSNFTNYLVKVRDLFTSTASQVVNMTYSTNGGSSYLSTNYSSGLYFNGTTNDDDESTTSFVVSGDNTTSSTNTGNVDITLYNVTNTEVKTIYVFGGSFQNFSSVMATRNGTGVQTGTTAINAIKFSVPAGTMTGKFYLYGIQEP